MSTSNDGTIKVVNAIKPRFGTLEKGIFYIRFEAILVPQRHVYLTNQAAFLQQGALIN